MPAATSSGVHIRLSQTRVESALGRLSVPHPWNGRATRPARLCAVVRVLAVCLGLLPCSPASAQSRDKPTLLAARPPLVTEETEKAIASALKFLASRQASDGAFRDQGGFGSYPLSMTSLAALGLMASGSTPTEGPYSPQLRKALTYALHCSQRNGLICPRGNDEESRSMYGHGFSMLFLAQVMGMEEDPERLARIRWVLQKGVALTEKSQSRLGGWLYTPDMSGDEGSVTVTQVQALRAARNAGIAVPKKVIKRAMKYLKKSVQPDGGIAYRVGMSGSRPPITAAAVACWFNAGEYDNPMALRALEYCKQEIGFGQSRSGVWGALLLLASVHVAGDVPGRRCKLEAILSKDQRPLALDPERRRLVGR